MFARTTAPPAIDPDRLAHPRLAECVALHPPQGEAGSWIIQRGESRYFRVTPDVARLAAEFDGERDHQQLALALGAPWRTADVGTVVTKLAGTGMLDDGSGFSRKRTPRIRLAPPLTVQLSLLHPGKTLAVLKPLVGRAMSGAGLVTLAALAVAGLLSLVLQLGALRLALTSPQPFLTYVLIFAGILLTTGIHEVAHGAVLTYYGGRPSRLGVMLFYLSPAFFCDVSDGWRLGVKADRVRVALAGIAVQIVVASMAAVLALSLPGSAVKAGLLLFAAATYLAAAFNLVPFIKLDGYIALMSHLDVSHLRQRAMVDGRRALARALFGGRYRRELPDLPWSSWYGLACMGFPIYVIAGALVIWVDMLTGLGFVGGGLVLLGLALIGYYVVRGGVRLCREGLAAGASRWRMGLSMLAVLGLAAAGLIGVKVPVTADGGYVIGDNGALDFVSSGAVNDDVLRVGQPVVLYRAGLAGREEVGAATLGSVTGAVGPTPLTALLPVDDLPMVVQAQHFPLSATAIPAGQVGAATIIGPDMPVWQRLALTYIVPFFRW